MKRKFLITEHFGKKSSHILVIEKVCITKLTLVVKERIVHKGKEVIETINKYFIHITKILRLNPSRNYDTDDFTI